MYYVCCVGIGGIFLGIVQYLKEMNFVIKIVVVDVYGLVLKKYWEIGVFDKNEIYFYKVEGFGKMIIFDNVDFDVIDDFIKVIDCNSVLCVCVFVCCEGLMVGYFSGLVMEVVFKLCYQLKFSDVVVVFLFDYGSCYLGKIYNDEWMKQ